MNLHEYQGKEILSSFGVRIQRGIVASNHKEAVDAAKQLTAETGTGVARNQSTGACWWPWKRWVV